MFSFAIEGLRVARRKSVWSELGQGRGGHTVVGGRWIRVGAEAVGDISIDIGVAVQNQPPETAPEFEGKVGEVAGTTGEVDADRCSFCGEGLDEITFPRGIAPEGEGLGDKIVFGCHLGKSFLLKPCLASGLLRYSLGFNLNMNIFGSFFSSAKCNATNFRHV